MPLVNGHSHWVGKFSEAANKGYIKAEERMKWESFFGHFNFRVSTK